MSCLLLGQDLAVGSDVDGVKVKDPMRTLLPVLLHPYGIHDKIRAVLLYIFSVDGTDVLNLSFLLIFFSSDSNVKCTLVHLYTLLCTHVSAPCLSSTLM